MNAYFHFRQFTIFQNRCAQKVSEVACVFGAWIPLPGEAIRVLDIGGGTGLLSLMLAQRFPACHIQSIEVEQDAFEQMQENFSASPFASRLQSVFGDIRSFEASATYDAIVVNPPFYEKQLKSPSATKNHAWHSDSLNLRELLDSLQRLLSPEGHAFLLWPCTREAELSTEMEKSRLHLQQKVRLAHSVQHPSRHLFIQLGFADLHSTDTMLYLRDGERYTSEVRDMLQEFYTKPLT